MTQINIPASKDEAVESLNGIGALLTAKQWERAAIVYAFTRNDGPGRPAKSADTALLTAKEFGRLGIAGMGETQVRAYRRAWQSAMEDGAPDVKPGDVIELPNLPWKEYFGEATPEVQERVTKAFLRDVPNAIEQLVQDDPELATKIAHEVVETPATRVVVESDLAEISRERFERLIASLPEHPDLSHELIRGVNVLVPVLRAIQRAEWTPTPTQAMLLHFVGALINQIGRFEEEPDEQLFEEIDKYLKESAV